MNAEFQEMAKDVTGQLQWLEDEYKAVTLDAFYVLLQHDPETAKLALEAFSDPTRAATWFGDRIQGLGGKTPWECISEGKTDRVHRTLRAIMYGTFA